MCVCVCACVCVWGLSLSLSVCVYFSTTVVPGLAAVRPTFRVREQDVRVEFELVSDDLRESEVRGDSRLA